MRAIPLRRLSASTVAFGTEFLVTHNSPEAMCDTQVVPFEMDLAVLSKDHAVTVASCGDTLTEIRYTTLKDATTRLLQRVEIGVGERLAIYLQIRFLCIFQRVSGQRKGDTIRQRAVVLEHVLGFGHALALGFECHRGAGSALGHDADAARNAERVIDLPIFLVVDQIPGLVVELLVVALLKYLLAVIQRRQMLLARIDRA